jgi:hypothetical protein
VTTVSLDDITKKLKTRMLDDVVELAHADTLEWKGTLANPFASILHHSHRYTIHVPDEDEQSVLNMGAGDRGRDLPDAGISARTTSHIHVHTTKEASSSFVALGGATAAERPGLLDPKKVLASNHGIGAVTNGHFWAEAQGQLNLASHTHQAVLRAHKGKLRLQADEANVEVGSGKTVLVGGAEGVSIVANSDVNPGDNAYGTGFDEALVEKSAALVSKTLSRLWTFSLRAKA